MALSDSHSDPSKHHLFFLSILACGSICDCTIFSKQVERQLEWLRSDLLQFFIQIFIDAQAGQPSVDHEGLLAIEQLFFTLSNHEVLALVMIEKGLHTTLVQLLRNTLSDAELLDQKQYNYALHTINNLSMWDSCKPALLSSGIVELLDKLSHADKSDEDSGDADVKMSMSTCLAYLVGSKDDKDNQLLVSHPTVLRDIMAALNATLQKKDYKNNIFTLFELVLAIRNLSLSDHNKPLLGTEANLALLLQVIRTAQSSAKEIELAAASLLELSFHDTVRKTMKAPRLMLRRRVERAMQRASDDAQHSLKQLLWLLNQGAVAGGPGTAAAKHIMISYSWAFQASGSLFLLFFYSARFRADLHFHRDMKKIALSHVAANHGEVRAHAAADGTAGLD